MEMESQPNQLNIIFLSFPSPSHMNPVVDTARLFAKHGASVTIITTQAYASTLQKTFNNDFNSGYQIRSHAIQFPVGLPVDGVEMSMFKDQIEQLFHDLRPDCVVTDLLYTWTVDSAAKLGIPRLCFRSSSNFANCAIDSIRKHKPHEGLVSDAQEFSIPGLPHNIEITTLQLPDWIRNKSKIGIDFEAIDESLRKSYGTLTNSFHEIESDYEKLYQSSLGIKSWSIGPVSAWVNRDDAEKEELIEEEAEWLKWLNTMQKESVVYVCFGSITILPHAQLVEIAHALENSGHDFIWVIRKKTGGGNTNNNNVDGDSFLQDFEHKMRERSKGYILWNWAPQVLILNHPAIGGIVTHCGWNSTLETVSAGLPMITWPIFAEQFLHEKLLVNVLKVGVAVGAKENKNLHNLGEDAMLSREEIAKAVKLLMGRGEESEERRERARKLGDAAKKAIEEGGSSYNNLMQLMEELKSLKISKGT